MKPEVLFRGVRGGAVVLATLVLGYALYVVAQSEVVVVTEEKNGEFVVAWYALRVDDARLPRLQMLRQRERLDAVTAPGQTQFEKIVLLRQWVRRQWEPGASFYYPPWDAVEILDLARRHDNRGFCAQYAVVFLQACQSLGLHARYVDLEDHFVTAVWSDDFNKWVIMDPTRDLHYEKNGTPMGGGQLTTAWYDGDPDGIVEVEGNGERRPIAYRDLRPFRRYSIDVWANQLTVPVEVRSEGRWIRLVHAADYRTYPRMGLDPLVVSSNFIAYRNARPELAPPLDRPVRDPDEFRYALNQTVIFLANDRLRDGILKIALLVNNSPTFERFEIRSDRSADWLASPTRFKWVLHPGMNELSARIETRGGWEGPISRLSMYYKPPLFAALPDLGGRIVRVTWSRGD